MLRRAVHPAWAPRSQTADGGEHPHSVGHPNGPCPSSHSDGYFSPGRSTVLFAWLLRTPLWLAEQSARLAQSTNYGGHPGGVRQ
jgi:hypothetical protein